MQILFYMFYVHFSYMQMKFFRCEFLLQRKGPDFVHRIVAANPNVDRPILRGPFDVPPPNRRGLNYRRPASPPPPIIDHQVRKVCFLVERLRGRVITLIFNLSQSALRLRIKCITFHIFLFFVIKNFKL